MHKVVGVHGAFVAVVEQVGAVVLPGAGGVGGLGKGGAAAEEAEEGEGEEGGG